MVPLADRFTRQQAQAVLQAVLTQLEAGNQPRVALQSGTIVESIAAKLSDDERRAGVARARAILGWSPQTSRQSGLPPMPPSLAAEAAAALIALLPQDSPGEYTAAVVDALKYPRAVGDATDVLLGGIAALHPNAPVARAGLHASLVWLRTAHKGIDQRARPVCPPPMETALHCPAQR
jgi:hypothetical protein